MRLIYLDEAGISHDETVEPWLTVAGVIIDGDHQWKSIEAALAKVAADWLPPYAPPNLVFHATEIYHGKKFWDRDVWPSAIRNQILEDIWAIIVRHQLPIIAGAKRKDEFGKELDSPITPSFKSVLMESLAAVDCIGWADQWIEKYARDEVALVIAEDSGRIRKLIRVSLSILRHPQKVAEYGLNEVSNLPFKHIVETVHFAGKHDSAPLQLADLCAFCFRRFMGGAHIPQKIKEELYPLLIISRDHLDKLLAAAARIKQATENAEFGGLPVGP